MVYEWEILCKVLKGGNKEIRQCTPVPTFFFVLGAAGSGSSFPVQGCIYHCSVHRKV